MCGRLPGGPVDRRVWLVYAEAASPEGMREVATERGVSDVDALHGIMDAATDCGAGALGRGASSAKETPKPVGALQRPRSYPGAGAAQPPPKASWLEDVESPPTTSSGTCICT